MHFLTLFGIFLFFMYFPPDLVLDIFGAVLAVLSWMSLRGVVAMSFVLFIVFVAAVLYGVILPPPERLKDTPPAEPAVPKVEQPAPRADPNVRAAYPTPPAVTDHVQARELDFSIRGPRFQQTAPDPPPYFESKYRPFPYRNAPVPERPKDTRNSASTYRPWAPPSSTSFGSEASVRRPRFSRPGPVVDPAVGPPTPRWLQSGQRMRSHAVETPRASKAL